MVDSTADHRRQGIGFASLRVLDSDVQLRKQVIKTAMPPFANRYWQAEIVVFIPPSCGVEGDGGYQKEPHDDMKKSSHTNKTDARTGLLFMRH